MLTTVCDCKTPFDPLRLSLLVLPLLQSQKSMGRKLWAPSEQRVLALLQLRKRPRSLMHFMRIRSMICRDYVCTTASVLHETISTQFCPISYSLRMGVISPWHLVAQKLQLHQRYEHRDKYRWRPLQQHRADGGTVSPSSNASFNIRTGSGWLYYSPFRRPVGTSIPRFAHSI